MPKLRAWIVLEWHQQAGEALGTYGMTRPPLVDAVASVDTTLRAWRNGSSWGGALMAHQISRLDVVSVEILPEAPAPVDHMPEEARHA